LTLDEAIHHLAWGKSNKVNFGNTKWQQKTRVAIRKNNRYPDLKSGTISTFSKCFHRFKLNKTSTLILFPVVDQLMIGQVNASLPLFAGFKIQTALKPTTICRS
jgi:hypothetical protein